MLQHNDLPEPNYLHLTLRYAGVLLFIALLTTMIFWISYSVTLEQQKDGELINVSGQQRTLTLQVEALGYRLLHESHPDARMDIQDHLTSVLEQLERTHLILAYGDLGDGQVLPTSAQVQSLFFDTGTNLDLKIRQYIDHGFALTVLDDVSADVSHPSLNVIVQIRPELDRGLDQVVAAYQMETDQKIAKLKAIQQAGLFAMLAVLLLSAIAVFRPMVQKIRASFQEVQSLNDQLMIRNVDLELAKDKFEKQGAELVGMSEDLLEAQQKAEQAQKAMGNFMSSMSHELRTPLNAILGFSQLMEYDANAPLTQSQQEGISIIKQSGEHLLTLINELLDLSKIEAGTIQIEDEQVNPRDVLDGCLALVQMQADKAGIAVIDETLDQDLPFVKGDGVRVKQVMLNFLSNAIKYNTADGRVMIRCCVEDDRMKLTVVDTGKGMSDQQMQSLFQPYARLGAEDTAIEGTGLGLTITKKLVELMHGEIVVESELGKGSAFSVTLPLAPVKDAVPA